MPNQQQTVVKAGGDTYRMTIIDTVLNNIFYLNKADVFKSLTKWTKNENVWRGQ